MDAIPAAVPTPAMVMSGTHAAAASAPVAQDDIPTITVRPDAATASPKQDTSWQDALPAVVPTQAMQMAHGDMPGPKDGGILANVGAGTSETVANTLGAPVDLATSAINLIPRGINAVAGTKIPTIENPAGGSDWLKNAFGFVGANPNTVAANTETEKMARAAGGGTASMLLPMGAARALPELAGIPGAVQQAFGAGGAPTMATAGAAGGAAGQLAQDSVPEPYKPIANLAGNVIGGGVPIGLRTAAGAATQAIAPTVSRFVAPLTAAGREATAGQRILGAASDAGAARDVLENQPPPLVPGSQPTTYQVTADQGLGNLERAVAKKNSDAFLQRAGEQNAARVAAIPGQSQTASPAAVGAAFRQHLADIDAAGEQAVTAARGTAQGATETLGGAVPVGADQQTSALQAYGQRLRGPLDEANQAQRARVSRLYDAVDPDGTLAVDMTGIKQAARGIAKDIPKNAAPMQGDAGSILGVMQMQPKVQPFREVQALRGRITDAMREELSANGRSTTYRRLTQMLVPIDDTLANGVEAAAGKDGGLADRLAATARGESGGPFAGVGGGQGAEGVPAGGAAGGGLPNGDGGAAQERSGNAGGGGAVAAETAAATEPELTPNFTPESAAKYRAANAAHAERAQTFENAPGVGQVLAPGQRKGEWKLGDSQVAATIFNAGKGAAERIQAFLKAGGSNPALVSDLKDYAAFDLRRTAEDADGTLNPGKAEKWLKSHTEALSAFPETAAAFRDAAAARATMDEAAARHLAAREAFEKSAASKFLGEADPVATVGKVLKSDTADATMRQLATLTAKNPAAREGLRKAVADYMLQELRSNALAGDTAERAFKSDTFQTFVRRAAPALRHIMEPEEIEGLQNVAADLQRANRSIVGTKLPGGSNTAQDVAAGEKHGGGKPSVVGTLVAMEAAGEAMHHLTGNAGRVIGMLAAPVFNAMRSHGLAKVDDLVTEAMLHPNLARALIAKVPAGSFAKPVWQNAAKQITALGATSVMRGMQAQ